MELESQCLRIKLQKGKTDFFLNWIKGVREKKPLLREALENAGIVSEMVYLERTPEADYIILFTRAKSLIASNAALLTSKLEIDIETRNIFKQTCEFEITPMELLLSEQL